MMADDAAPATSLDSADPLARAELIRVSLEANGVYLQFKTSTVQLYGHFVVQRAGQPHGVVTPTLKQGNLEALWALIGQRVTDVRLGELATFAFEGGTTLLLPPDTWRGEILSTLDDSKMGWDEF